MDVVLVSGRAGCDGERGSLGSRERMRRWWTAEAAGQNNNRPQELRLSREENFLMLFFIILF